MRFIRNNPLILLALAVVGFVAWIVSEQVRRPTNNPTPLVGMTNDQIGPRVDWPNASSGPSVVTSDLVPQLKPGMSRSEVEALIGPPPADMVAPVVEADGRFTYRVGYLANFDPVPVRPITVPSRRPLPTPPVVPKSLIALEFDASRPGHPLLSVQYPDPLY